MTCDGCLWCIRPWSTKHPLAHVLAKRPDATLPRQAERSTQCSICKAFVAEAYPAVDAGDRKAKLAFLDELSKCTEKRTEYDESLARYEANLNSNGLGRPSNDDELRPLQQSMQAMAGINVEENVYINDPTGNGEENLVFDHITIGKIFKMIACPACCLFVPLTGKSTQMEYIRQCSGCCSCPYAVMQGNVGGHQFFRGRVSDIGCCENGMWFCCCPYLNCTGHFKVMSLQDANDTEKFVFTKQLFPCWPCVQVCAIGCAPLGICALTCRGCCNYCSGSEFLTISQPVYEGPWKRSSDDEPVQLGTLVQSYRFVPIGPCTAVPTPLKFYFKPDTEKGKQLAQDHLALISLTLMIYRGLPQPCKLCSCVGFQKPSGVYCLDLGLGTHTKWNTASEVMADAETRV